jgi:hypothetical protein
MHDLSADWKRWSPVERVLAVTLTVLVAAAVPVALAWSVVIG